MEVEACHQAARSGCLAEYGTGAVAVESVAQFRRRPRRTSPYKSDLRDACAAINFHAGWDSDSDHIWRGPRLELADEDGPAEPKEGNAANGLPVDLLGQDGFENPASPRLVCSRHRFFLICPRAGSGAIRPTSGEDEIYWTMVCRSILWRRSHSFLGSFSTSAPTSPPRHEPFQFGGVSAFI